MQELYKQDSFIILTTQRLKKRFYLEPKLSMVRMSEMLEFKAQFNKYHFE